MSRSQGVFKTKSFSRINNIPLSVLSKATKPKDLHNLKQKRQETPIYASTKKASYTVEAAVVLPLSIFLFVFIIYFFRVLYVGVYVDSTVSARARQEAVLCSSVTDKPAIKTIYECSSDLRKDKIVKNEILGGIYSIDYSDSDTEHNYIHVVAKYRLKNPIIGFGKKYIMMNASGCSRKWIGFDPLEGSGESDFVYVTKYGEAYHSTLHCSYLKPSIKAKNVKTLKQLRNKSGGKYKSCPVCKGKKNNGQIYITDYGDAYHSQITCSGLKRTIRRIKKDKADDYHACGKCMGEK